MAGYYIPLVATPQIGDNGGGGGGGGGGSGSGVLVVNIDEEYTALDKTWKEIHDAAAQGKVCVVVYIEDDNVEQGRVSYVGVGGAPGSETYGVYVTVTQGTEVAVVRWLTDSESGYPAIYSG